MSEQTLIPFEEYRNKNCPFRFQKEHYCYTDPLSQYEVFDERSPDLANMLSECHGLQYDNIPASGIEVPDLAQYSYIPIVQHSSGNLFTDFTPAIVGVMLKDIVSSDGTHARKNIRSYISTLPDTQIILFPYGDDQLQENFWANQRTIYRELSEQGIHAITSPNYSIWDCQPAMEQNINLKRSLVSYDLMGRAGLAAIPHFYWKRGDKLDIKRTADWVNGRPSIKFIALNFQTFQSNKLWEQAINDLQDLIGLLNNPIHFIINGPQEPYRILQLVKITEHRLTLAGAQASMATWHRYELSAGTYGLKRTFVGSKKNKDLANQTKLFNTPAEKTVQPISLGELFRRNCELFDKLVQDSVIKAHWPDIMEQIELTLAEKSPVLVIKNRLNKEGR